MIPYGYCHCGCNKKTKLSKSTNKRFGWIKGKPLRYIYKHRERAIKPNPLVINICKGCGGTFKTKSYRRRNYCTTSCSFKFSNRKFTPAKARLGCKRLAEKDETFYARRGIKISASLKRKCQIDELFYQNQLQKALKNNKKYSYGTRTVYNRITFMSKLEASTAKLLDILKEKWNYEKLKIRYVFKGKRRTYIPDFYLPYRNLIIEVKPEFRLSNEEVLAKQHACLKQGYDYLFCTEKILRNKQTMYDAILGLC